MFFDKLTQQIDESIAYSSLGGASPQLLKQLQGFKAVDTPIYSTYGNGSANNQLTEQAEWTLLERNAVFNQIDTISSTPIAKLIKDVIISDGFCDLNGGYAMTFKYNDDEHKEKADLFTQDIADFLKRTRFVDILKDCVSNEGMDYGEIFLYTPVECGRGITEVTDSLDLRELLAIYRNTELAGAIKFDIEGNKRAKSSGFLKADSISHFMLNYKKKAIKISKTFTDKYNIAEKIRVAEPILACVVDLIQQYNALEKLQTAMELIKATQGVYLGIGISPEQDTERVSKQLQEFTIQFNRNRKNVVDNIQNIDVDTLMSSMSKIEFIPYSVEEGTNSVRQIEVDYPENKLSDILNNIRKVIALSVGIPEQNLSTSTDGLKNNKEDNITTNPMYSRMLSRIQQLLAKGIRETFYKHLKYKYSNEQGLLTKSIDKDKIEILFNATTNLNDRLEDEGLLLKAETVGSMLGVIEEIASSVNIPVKVRGDMIIEYWKRQMYKDVYLRDCIELMTPEEQKQMQLIATGVDGEPEEASEVTGEPDEVQDEVEIENKEEESSEEPTEEVEKVEQKEEIESTDNTQKSIKSSKSRKRQKKDTIRDIFPR